MRANKLLLNRIGDVLVKCPHLSLAYLKTEKDDATDITLLALSWTDDDAAMIRSYLHPKDVVVTIIDYPQEGSLRVELFDVEV